MQTLENKALSGGIIGKSAPTLAEITIWKSQDIKIDRRTLLRIVSGSIGSIALYDAMNSVNKDFQIADEAKKEAINLGKNPANQEELNLARQIESESGRYILRERTPEEIRIAQAAKSQQKDFLDSAREIYNVHYADKIPSTKRICGALALAATGVLVLVFGGKR